MTIFDRYILVQIMRPLAAALIVALVVFLFSRFMTLMDLILGAEGPLRLIFEIMGYLVPRYLSMALPISLLLGVMIAFNKMARDGETDAMQAAGFGLMRQVRSSLAIALTMVVISAIVIGQLKPYARYAYQAMVYAVSQAAFHASVRAGVFATLGDVTFLVQGIGPDGVTFARVFLYEEQEDGRANVIAARDGGLSRAEAGGPPVLRLFDGSRISIDRRASGSEADPEGVTSVLRFEELRTILGPDHALMFRPRGANEREMTIIELWNRRDQPPEGVRTSDLIAELHARIVSVLSIPFLPLFAVALAFGRRRSERFAGFAAGLALLVVYEQILDFGKNSAETGAVSPLVALWLPFFCFASAAGLFFARVAFVVPSTPALDLSVVAQRARRGVSGLFLGGKDGQ
jgi:lipopolysaccharide export system permease protein